jgi:Phytanoyl-CoA dioxygenase (PhyH)
VEVGQERLSVDGFLAVRDAVAPETVRACVDVIENELRARAVDPRDPRTWTQPVVRLPCPEGPAFAAAGTSPALRAMYDALLGAEGWIPRAGVGGTIPVRFPSTKDPGDAGWHIDGSYDVDGQWWVNVHSRGRGLLALFLLTDVSEADAPTEILVGSHLDVPRVLAPFGAKGVFFGDVTEALPASTFQRSRARATGRAGDVYVCHPFLVHRATWPHRGSRPRMIAQPAIALHEPFALRDGAAVCAVEQAILRGLR